MEPKEKPTGYLSFDSEARLFDLIGRQSISDPIIALLEVIKNAYDADATKIVISFKKMKTDGKIIIHDNGCGMSLDDIKNKWMKIGTTDKLDNPITRRGRRKIGEKGIGRFALQKLAKRLTLTTKVKGEKYGFNLEINWNNFNERVPASSVWIPFQRIKFPVRNYGTQIVLSNLREKWTGDMIKKVYEEIRILHLKLGKDKFDIEIHAPEFPKYTGKPKITLLNFAVYRFSAKLAKNGKIKYEMKRKAKKSLVWKDKNTRLTCGPLEFVFYFFYRNRRRYELHANLELTMKQLKEIRGFLDKWGGVKLYRDKFRVKPFGDIGNDWILLDKRRVQKPGFNPGNDQIWGYIKITRDENPGIVDITTREGILKEKPYRDMFEFIQQAIRVFVNWRVLSEPEKKKRRKKAKTVKDAVLEAKKKKIQEKPELIFDFDIKKVAEELKPELLKDIEDLERCFSAEVYRGCMMFAARILELLLSRKYFDRTSVDPVENRWGLEKIIGKCKEEEVFKEPGLAEMMRLINETRVPSVHKKKQFYVPTPEETEGIVKLLNSSIKKILRTS